MEIGNLIPTQIGNTLVDKRIEGDRIKVSFLFKSKNKSSLLLPSFIDEDKLFFAGISIFASEGTNKLKSNGNAPDVEVVNSNPAIITTFIRFLESLGFSKSLLKARMELTISPSENLNISQITEYWSKLTGIESKKFLKPIIKNGNGKNRKSEYGSLILLLFNKPLWRILSYWSKNLDQILYL